MATKLIHNTLRVHLSICAIAIIISLPIFYHIVENLWVDDVDESLLYQKEDMVKRMSADNFSDADISNLIILFQKTNNGIEMTRLPNTIIPSDTFYFNNYYDVDRKHNEPFRELCSYVSIHNKSYKIVLRRDLVESEDLLWGVVLTLLILLVVIFTLFVVVSTFYSRKIWLPFYKIIDKLKKLQLNKQTNIYIDCNNIVEFEDLKESVNLLIQQNYKIFLSQRLFTENASHEIQTPLSVIKAQMNILASSANLTESQLTSISAIEKQLRYCSAINRGLLMLAKIDNNQYLLNEDVMLDSIITEYCDTIAEEVKLISKHIELNINSITLHNSNSVLVSCLCRNLIRNAIKYSSDKSTIYITLSDTTFSVSNYGIDNPLDKEKIFTRFYRNSSLPDGCGLGLSIAMQISKLLHYNLSYNYTNKGCHTFSFSFV